MIATLLIVFVIAPAALGVVAAPVVMHQVGAYDKSVGGTCKACKWVGEALPYEEMED
jgi:hypothetical protein